HGPRGEVGQRPQLADGRRGDPLLHQLPSSTLCCCKFFFFSLSGRSPPLISPPICASHGSANRGLCASVGSALRFCGKRKQGALRFCGKRNCLTVCASYGSAKFGGWLA